ncbi:Tic20 family protein [Myxosarcina sp. GI1]|uniref:Tic20 family protein n=1 Tax=Myxosarcina sp. GI1 TaxID=1541065 RepID=UPI00056076B4|nr:Tic20 family protein [Myxosarcina sp. GI1]
MANPETDAKGRFFAALVYILPLIYALPFGLLLLKQFPFLGIIYTPIAPLLTIYYTLPFAGLIIFFALWFAVVRNSNIDYFIRFNTMQVIMLDIILIVCSLIMNILSSGFGGQSLITETLNNTIFIGTVVISFYGIIQSARGSYAEIPALSEAVSSQIR